MPRRLFALSRRVVVALSLSSIVLIAALFIARNAWRGARVLEESAHAVRSAGDLAFSLEPLGRGGLSPFHRALNSADFLDAAAFEGDLFVCGRSSLMCFDANGTLKQAWYTGDHLPPYPLTSMAVRRGIGSPELWVGTDGAGVLIFDGQAVRQMAARNQAARKISALLSIGTGRMILGTQTAGVLVADGKRLGFLNPQFAGTEVTALSGSADELWIGTRRTGAWMWRSGEAVHFVSELADAQVLSLHSRERTTWVGTPLGVAEFINGEFRRHVAEGVFAQTLLLHAGRLLIGSIDRGITGIDLHARLLRVEGRSAMPVSSLDTADRNVVSLEQIGNDVFAISPEHVHRLSSGASPSLSLPGMLAAGHISALHVDSGGRLWIGTFDRGLDIAGQGTDESVRHVESDVMFCINRIKEDPSTHQIAVATANGLALFDTGGRVRQVLDRSSGLASGNITDLLFDENGSLAAATPSGISFIEHGSISTVSAFGGLVNNHVYTLARRGDTLVAGTLGGFSVLRNGAVQVSYSTANSTLRQNWITAAAAADDAMYLGTYGSGVIRLENNSHLTAFREFQTGRIEINPNALLVTGTAVYAGTAGQGLATLRRGEERWRFVTNGLPSLHVTALAARGGKLYVGTDNGLVSAAEQDLKP